MTHGPVGGIVIPAKESSFQRKTVIPAKAGIQEVLIIQSVYDQAGFDAYVLVGLGTRMRAMQFPSIFGGNSG